MKFTYRFLSTLLLVVGLAATVGVSRANYSTNFDDFAPDETVDNNSAQPGWLTNDTNEANFVGFIDGYSTSPTDYWALIGGNTGFAPSNLTNYLWHPADLTNGGKSALLNVEMSIAGGTIQDTFGWAFLDSSQNLIASINFTPGVGHIDVTWSDYLGNTSSTAYFIGDNAIYNFTMSIKDIGTAAPHMYGLLQSGTDPTYVAVDAVLPSGTPDVVVDSIASVWAISGTSPSDYGTDNSLVFDNYQAVPEPSTLALGLLGLGAAVVAYRARMRTARL